MLPEETSQRIREEELFRLEVRSELAAEIQNKAQAEPKKNKVWLFLNSTLGMWVLGTVALGLVSFGYTTYTDYRTQKQERSTRIRKLDLEIEWRLSQFIMALEPYAAHDEKGAFVSPLRLKPEYTGQHVLKLWHRYKDLPANNGPQTIHAEFEKRNLASLMVELDSILTEEERRKPESEDEETPFYELISSAVNQTVVDLNLRDWNGDDLHRFTVPFYQRVLLSRWRTTTPYTDCSGEDPFC
jgi:hypothetical protein